MTTNEELAVKLQRLACAENEREFFNCLSDNIGTICEALSAPTRPLLTRDQWQDDLDYWAKKNLPSESAACITSWSDRIAEFIVVRVLTVLPLNESGLADHGHGQNRDKTREDVERAIAEAADIRKLDAVVHILGIEDSEDDPSEVCRQLLDRNECQMIALQSISDECKRWQNTQPTSDGASKGWALHLQMIAEAAISTSQSGTAPSTCYDCGKLEPCDNDCPNASALTPATRGGEAS